MMIVFFFLQAVVALLVHFIWITSDVYSGGAIGMVALTLLVCLPIQIVISSLLYMLSSHKMPHRFRFVYIMLNWIILEITLYFLTGTIAVLNILHTGLEGFISRSYSLSYLFATIFVVMLYHRFIRVKHKM